MKYLMYFHVMMLEVNNFRKYKVIINKKELRYVDFLYLYCSVQSEQSIRRVTCYMLYCTIVN